MEYTALMRKIAAEQLHLNPTLVDVMSRVREAGLHKVAAQMHNVPAFEIKTAAQLLGTRLYASRQRQTKIASGLRALVALETEGALPFDAAASGARRLGAAKVASMFRLGPNGIKNLMPEAGQAAQQASHAMPKTLGPSVAEGAQHAGLFGGMKPHANDLDLGQTIAKMRNEEMSMGIRPSAPIKGQTGAAPQAQAVTPPKPSQFRDVDPGMKQLTDDVGHEMQHAHEGVANIPGLKPVPEDDAMMWRNIYDATKLREGEAAMRGQSFGLHPSSRGSNPTVQAKSPTPVNPEGATVPGRRIPPQVPPAGPGATRRLV